MSLSYFHISNYIVGKPDTTLIPMTIGANGAKIYTALDYATIFNADLNLEYQFSADFKWKGQLIYRYGQDLKKKNLPFISPLRYAATFDYRKGKFSSEIAVQGNATQTQFNPFYGKDSTPDCAILNFDAGYSFAFEKAKCSVKAGIENISDTYYSTFSDWNNISRKGRNLFLNVAFGF